MFTLFGSQKKTEQTQNYTDQSANAGGQNSIALGSGANLQISTSDPALVGRALSTVDAGVSNSLATVGRALSTVDYSTQQDTTRFLAALEAVRSDSDASRRSEAGVQAAAQNAIQTTASLAQALSAQVADSKKDPNNQTVETVAKYAGVVAVAGAAVFALFLLKKGHK